MHVRVSRDEGRIAMVVPLQAVGNSAVVPKQLVGRPETIAVHLRECTLVCTTGGRKHVGSTIG